MTLAIAPFGWSVWFLPILLGMAFGATLERSGFGDSRRLAAQFYFTEMRVLKVMFTAIVTCLLWITLASTLGVLDFGALTINPTYLGTAVVGGLLLGIGFVIGGYCPGTSIVSAATGKVDGMFFLGGVGAGVFVFGEVGGAFRTFYDTAGYLGRSTLPEALGLPFGVVVALVVLMASGMFWGATLLERRFGAASSAAAPATAVPSTAPRGPVSLRPAMLRAGGVVALAVVLVGFARPAAGGGAIDERVRLLAPEHDAALASRNFHLDPLEVAGLMHQSIGCAQARFHLVLLDLRDESEFNRFHLVDARRTSVERLFGDEGRALADPRYATSIKVLLSDDEAAAEAAWRVLRAQGAAHVYVLAGGVNLWLDVFREGRLDAQPAPGTVATDRMRHSFPSSLGDRYAFARPSEETWRRLVASKKRAYEPHARPVTKAGKASGGCG